MELMLIYSPADRTGCPFAVNLILFFAKLSGKEDISYYFLVLVIEVMGWKSSIVPLDFCCYFSRMFG
jgi:hypothetical protein